jgi:hypothetical protein
LPLAYKNIEIVTTTHDLDAIMLWERFFIWHLRREMDRWEHLGLIESDALDALRRYYGFQASEHAQADTTATWSRRILYLAIITFLAAFFSFAGSAAIALIPPIRVGLLALAAISGIVTGCILHARHRISSMVCVTLGAMLLPITFFFAIHYYAFWPLTHPFWWWSVLGLAMAAGLGPLAQQWQEVGLATSALLSALSVPFLYAVHAEAAPLVYAAISVVAALVMQRWRAQLSATWHDVWGFPLWFLGYGLAVAAGVLPVALHRYGTLWAGMIYFLAAVYFVFEGRTSQRAPTIAAFVLALLAGVGAWLRLGRVELVYYPLAWLAVSVTLLAVSLYVLPHQPRAMTALLDTLQGLVWISSIGLWLLPPDDFLVFHWRWATVVGYGILGTGVYLLAWRPHEQAWRLAYLAAWHLVAAWRLACLGRSGFTVELYTLPSGVLLMLNAFVFVDRRWRESAVAMAVAMLAMPSLLLSISDGGAFRTVWLALGGIGLVGLGAWCRNNSYLSMGGLVMMPAIAAKLAPDLADLGLPRFVWFVIFGTLLVGIAGLLQYRQRLGRGEP